MLLASGTYIVIEFFNLFKTLYKVFIKIVTSVTVLFIFGTSAYYQLIRA